jgi:LPS export ABC transporter protein LptC
MNKTFILIISISFLISLLSCSFDYGQSDGADSDQPDIVMENVEYVRVRTGNPQARFRAERAERYEERQIMELINFTFEQFGQYGEEVNAYGKAGTAFVEIDSGDIRLGDGVRIEVESEDIIIETKWLQWKDKDRILYTGEDDEVFIYQPSGTSFTGSGFSANARRRSWEFAGGVSGTYIKDDDEEDAEADKDSEAEEETLDEDE